MEQNFIKKNSYRIFTVLIYLLIEEKNAKYKKFWFLRIRALLSLVILVEEWYVSCWLYKYKKKYFWGKIIYEMKDNHFEF